MIGYFLIPMTEIEPGHRAPAHVGDVVTAPGSGWSAANPPGPGEPGKAWVRVLADQAALDVLAAKRGVVRLPDAAVGIRKAWEVRTGHRRTQAQIDQAHRILGE